MTLGPITKIALGSVAALGTAATGLSIHHLFNQPSTIGEELHHKEGLKLLGNSDDKWKALVEKHKETGNITKIAGLNLSESSSQGENLEEKNKKELQEKCESLWNTEISKTAKTDRDRMKQEIKDWCVTDPQILKVRNS